MKKIFALLVLTTLLAPYSAHAENEKPAQPIRIAKIQGQIMKDFVERINGGISVRTEVVCVFESTVPVYDVREQNGYYVLNPNVTCSSTIGDTKVNVTLTGYLTLVRWGLKEPQDIKGAGMFLKTSADKGEDVTLPTQLTAYSGTKDLSARSMILFVAPSHDASEARPAKQELFSASAEFIDDSTQ